jgi:pimeloyl-ACP methyl ester carboxylesterase
MVEVQARGMLLLSREASATLRMIEHLVPVYTLIRSLLAEPLSQRRLRFIGVDRPGYGYSCPRPEAGLLDCAEDFVRVAERLGIERFSAIGFSGGGPYALALGALVPERVGGVAVVSGLGMLDRPDAFEGMDEANAADFEMAGESPEVLATELDEAAREVR